MARQISVRNVPEELSRRLEALSRERGMSVNSTVIALLEEAVGIEGRRKRLARYATWGVEDLETFARNLADQRVVDPKLWG
jgi:plasmid stability protein